MNSQTKPCTFVSPSDKDVHLMISLLVEWQLDLFSPAHEPEFFVYFWWGGRDPPLPTPNTIKHDSLSFSSSQPFAKPRVYLQQQHFGLCMCVYTGDDS